MDIEFWIFPLMLIGVGAIASIVVSRLNIELQKLKGLDQKSLFGSQKLLMGRKKGLYESDSGELVKVLKFEAENVVIATSNSVAYIDYETFDELYKLISTEFEAQ